MTDHASGSSEEDEGAALFQSFVDATEELRKLWRVCSSHPDLLPQDTLLTIDFRRYQGQPALELHLDCEAKSGNAFAWCTDVEKRGPLWTVERSVRMNDRAGQHVLIELAQMEFGSSGMLAKRLPLLVRELTATFERVDLAAK